MKNLFKYEIRKTLIAKLILAAVTLLVEVFFATALIRANTNQQLIAIGMLAGVALTGIAVIGIRSVVTLHRDMNTREGYMLFMTPNSGYKILGAKVLENTVSTLLAGGIFFGLGCLNISLMKSCNQDLTETVEMLTGLAGTFGFEMSFRFGDIALFVLYILVSWLNVVTMAYFADIVISSVLNGKKMNGLLGFLLFLALSYASGRIEGFLPGDSAAAEYGIRIAYYAVITAGMYFGAAKLMERHLSV